MVQRNKHPTHPHTTTRRRNTHTQYAQQQYTNNNNCKLETACRLINRGMMMIDEEKEIESELLLLFMMILILIYICSCYHPAVQTSVCVLGIQESVVHTNSCM